MRTHQTSFGIILGTLLVAAGNVALGNPSGGTVRQGTATFNTSGSQLTINTSAQAFINWQSFNIGAGETTTFVQPSSSSIVWNQINDPSPSQILGTLNANGYVVLQNANGFFIGGQASITTHGLLMTTAPIAPPDLSSGGPWSFSAPPPTASIINYGQINIGGGGSAFLIAHDIENHGSINAPGGSIGLYAGQTVLVSTRPDGRGLSAQVTLPEGSVDNSGKLIADGGTIALHAQVVNQGGLVQANSVKNINGTIELVASDSLNLGANSVLSAQGDSLGVSAGGSITLNSGNTFSDLAGSTIDIRGGAGGGAGGQLEISSANLDGIASQIEGQAAAGFHGGTFTIDPMDLNLTSTFVSGLTPVLDSGLYQINLQADHNITLSTSWTLNDPGAAALLTLTAGNDIILNTGSGITAGKNWSLSLNAGPQNLAAKPTTSRTDGIYLDGTAFIQSMNGNINLNAANEVLVSSGAIRTIGGGNIEVNTLVGNVNTGTSTSGYNYIAKATGVPFYTPFSVNAFTGAILPTSNLGGISTAAGGDVTINAGGDVTSFFANSGSSKTVIAADPGAGAFGGGDVSITAGGNVYGHYVVANGTGTIKAGQNIGTPGQNVALSLAVGGWNLTANGNIYLQEVRNPNGVFDTSTGAGGHFFDYSDDASVNLTAGDGIFLTDASLPRTIDAVPVIYPPNLTMTAGSGGINLQGPVILFPSADQNLNIATTGGGDFIGGTGAQISMSDTSTRRWTSGAFGLNDIGTSPLEINNPNSVIINIAGDMENIGLVTDKQTQITVGGNMVDCNFSGQNLHPGDTTSIDVTGSILNRISFNSVFLTQVLPNLPTVADVPPNEANDWRAPLLAAVDPTVIANMTLGTDPTKYQEMVNSALLFGSIAGNFFYNQGTGRLTYGGQLDFSMAALLEQPLTVVRYDTTTGLPLTQIGADGKPHFVTDTINWADPVKIAALATASQGTPAMSSVTGGYAVGGPGSFTVNASSISLGNTLGIISYGVGTAGNGVNYSYLAPYTPSGASIDVTVAGDLEMQASTIAALGGGNVKVTSTGGSMDLGSQDLLDVEQAVVKQHNMALGIYTSGAGNVDVTAQGNISVNSSRIAAFNGGNVSVESLEGNVDAGVGGLDIVPINYYYVSGGKAVTYQEPVFANGIVAETLMDATIPGGATLPGNITVTTPRGDIIANAGGILQEALSGNVEAPGPTITLTAGSDGFKGNISLGSSGVIGGSVIANASGDITGLVISRQNSTVNAAGTFTGTLLSGGTVTLAATSVGGSTTIFGAGGVSVSGNLGSGAQVLGQNVSVNGGTSQNTLGATATATATSQSAAGQASEQSEQQVASDDSQDDDKKKKGKGPLLAHRVGRVTVLLPAKS